MARHRVNTFWRITWVVVVIGIAAVWWSTYGGKRGRGITYQSSGGNTVAMFSFQGNLFLSWVREVYGVRQGWTLERSDLDDIRSRTPSRGFRMSFRREGLYGHGVNFQWMGLRVVALRDWGLRDAPDAGPTSEAVWGIVLPYWLLEMFMCIPLFMMIQTERRRMHRRRMGLCTACGYDLRATPGRCPECGTVRTVHAG
jgi:hypothetical protein